jgi:hypothetical protein
VRQSLLDGVVVSSFSLGKPLAASQGPQWQGLCVMPLGQLELQLVAAKPATRRVLLLRKGAKPLL